MKVRNLRRPWQRLKRFGKVGFLYIASYRKPDGVYFFGKAVGVLGEAEAGKVIRCALAGRKGRIVSHGARLEVEKIFWVYVPGLKRLPHFSPTALLPIKF